jgi:hypothetical protein
MQNSPFFWLEYGLIRQKELIEDAQWDAAPRACPTASQKLWQRTTSQLEKLTMSLGLQWRVAYAPTCRNG